MNLFYDGLAGHLCYRIPVLLQIPGVLLAFAEARGSYEEDAGEVAVVVRRSLDGGASWGPVELVAKLPGDTLGNPAPVWDGSRIHLFLTWNAGDALEEDIVARRAPQRIPYYCWSDNAGESWTEPEAQPQLTLPEWGWYATGPNRGVALASEEEALPGEKVLLIPCNHSEPDGTYRSHILGRPPRYSISDLRPSGGEWQIAPFKLPDNSNESGLTLLGEVPMMDMRDELEDRRHLADLSTGEVWVPPIETAVCQAGIVAWGDLLLISAPAQSNRTCLTINVSWDGGRTFPWRRLVTQAPSAYSSLELLEDDRLAILYERDDYTKITLETFTREQLFEEYRPAVWQVFEASVTVEDEPVGLLENDQLGYLLPTETVYVEWDEHTWRFKGNLEEGILVNEYLCPVRDINRARRIKVRPSRRDPVSAEN